MKKLSGKKLLIIGGAIQHLKVVEAAHDLGVEVIVDDYLPIEKSITKQKADKYYVHNITDIDDIVEMCKKEGVDGIIATSLDACQMPYQKVCEALGKPCFGTAEQFKILTDKTVFKDFCKKNGFDTIPEFKVEDFANEELCNSCVSFPIFIKPCDSRGSRGQSVCYTYEEALKAIEFAKSESASGNIVIEKYMGQDNDFCVSLIVINGEVFPVRTVDRVLGNKEDGLDKVAVGSLMPSRYTNLYLKNIHSKVENFIRKIGLTNAPAFMQGFVDGDTIRFYDPGLRFPGGEYERMFNYVTEKNLFYPLIEFALTGKVESNYQNINKEDVLLKGKTASKVLPTLKAGKITKIEGLDAIKKHQNIVCCFERFNEGDIISESHNVNQRFGEICIVCDTVDETKKVIEWIYDTLKITDENGNDMIVSRYDSKILDIRKEYFGK